MNPKLRKRTDRVIWLLSAAFLAIFAAHEVFANSPPANSAAPSVFETYRNECGACHVAYPPRLLPASSWQALMNGLDKHFGVDASLDEQTASTIASFLARSANAGLGHDLNTSPIRITDTAWFRHEHDEIPPAVWRRQSIGSPANCTACHADAAKERFSEHTVRIPN